jgi:integrase
MAHIRKQSTGKYQVRYRDPTGRERARNFRRRSDAEKYLVSVEADKLRGMWVDPRLGRISFSEWAAEVQQTNMTRRPATVYRVESMLRSLVLPTFGKMTLSSIRPVTVRRWIADLVDAGYASTTVRTAHALLSSVLKAAVRDGLLPKSPAEDTPLPKVEHREMRFLSHDEIGDLAQAVDPRYRALVLTAGYTGLRFGELAGLEVRHLEMLRRSLRVDQAMTDVGGRVELGPVKTSSSRRTVKLPRFLVDELAQHLAAFPSGAGLVFSAERGGPIRRTNFRRREWLPAVAASVGVPCRFHDLRHSHAALLIADGSHPKVIQARLGHSSIRTTLDTYGHLFEGLDEAAADRLDASYQEALADSPRTVARS